MRVRKYECGIKKVIQINTELTYVPKKFVIICRGNFSPDSIRGICYFRYMLLFKDCVRWEPASRIKKKPHKSFRNFLGKKFYPKLNTFLA